MNFHQALESTSSSIREATEVRQSMFFNVTSIILNVMYVIDKYMPVIKGKNVYFVKKGNKLVSNKLSSLYVKTEGGMVSLAKLPLAEVKSYLRGNRDGDIYKANGKLFVSRRCAQRHLSLTPDKTFVLMSTILSVFKKTLEEGNDVVLYPSKITPLNDILSLGNMDGEEFDIFTDKLITAIDPLVVMVATEVSNNPDYLQTVYNVGLTRDGGRIKLERLGSIYEFKHLEYQRENEYFG